MAVSGLPEPCTTHARDIARLALDMMDLAKEVIVDGEPVVGTSKVFCHFKLVAIRGLSFLINSSRLAIIGC